jgi:hypothetical protein
MMEHERGNYRLRPRRATNELDNVRRDTQSTFRRDIARLREQRRKDAVRIKSDLHKPKIGKLKSLKLTLISKIKPIQKSAKHLNRREIKIAIPVLLVLIALPFIFRTKKANPTTGTLGVSQVEQVTPLLPSSNNVKPTDIRKNETTGTLSFIDSFKNVDLTITQQVLPQDLKDNPSKIQEIAASIGAKEAFDSVYGKAYFATADAPNAVGQRVVFATNERLIFISAPSKFDAATWAEYIKLYK